MRILLIEDDRLTAQSIETMLKISGFRVDSTESGSEGLEFALTYDYDIVLLDLRLDDMSGLDVLRELRNSNIRSPVLILSGLGELDDRVKGLKLGADDYMTKPFHKEELVARINAVVRRSTGHAASVINIGPISVDIDRQIATVNDFELDLTASEYTVLELLAMRKGATVTKESMMNHLYGGLDEPIDKIIDVFICTLRRKIVKAGGDGSQLRTMWGRGYMFEDRKASEENAENAA